MGKFVVVYKGGAMAETPEAQEATMQRWMQWFGGLGSSVTDFGNPFGPSVALNRLFGFQRGIRLEGHHREVDEGASRLSCET